MFAAYHHIQLWIRNANMQCALLHCMRLHRTISIQIHAHGTCTWNGPVSENGFGSPSKSILFYGSRVFAVHCVAQPNKTIHSLCSWAWTIVFNIRKRWIGSYHHPKMWLVAVRIKHTKYTFEHCQRIKYSNEKFPDAIQIVARKLEISIFPTMLVTVWVYVCGWQWK